MSNHITLHILEGTVKPESVRFDQDLITIGRNPSNDLVIDNRLVSDFHAKISKINYKYYLEDLNSLNGIFYENHKLNKSEKVELQNGKAFSLGSVIIKVSFSKTQTSSLPDTIKNNQDNQENKKNNKKPIPKLLIGSCIGLCVFCLLMLFLKVLFINDEQTIQNKQTYPNYSDQPVSFPVPQGKIYGFTRNDDEKTHPDKVIFTFYAKSIICSLNYKHGGTNAQEIAIILNSKKIAFVPMSQAGWMEQTIKLPAEIIEKNTNNIIEFIHSSNLIKTQKETWGIKDVSIQFIQGKCDLENGKYYYKLAKQFFDQQTISIDNLYNSQKYCIKAISYIENCPSEQSKQLLLEYNKKLENIIKLLDNKYNDLLFKYTKSLETNEMKKAIDALERILLLIPDREDKRYKQAKRLLKRIR